MCRTGSRRREGGSKKYSVAGQASAPPCPPRQQGVCARKVHHSLLRQTRAPNYQPLPCIRRYSRHLPCPLTPAASPTCRARRLSPNMHQRKPHPRLSSKNTSPGAPCLSRCRYRRPSQDSPVVHSAKQHLRCPNSISATRYGSPPRGSTPCFLGIRTSDTDLPAVAQTYPPHYGRTA